MSSMIDEFSVRLTSRLHLHLPADSNRRARPFYQAPALKHIRDSAVLPRPVGKSLWTMERNFGHGTIVCGSCWSLDGMRTKGIVETPQDYAEIWESNNFLTTSSLVSDFPWDFGMV